MKFLHGPSNVFMFQLKYHYSYFPVKQKTGKKHKRLTSQSGQHPNYMNHFSEKISFPFILYIFPTFLS